MTTSKTRNYQDTAVDVKFVLCALWIATMLVFAYVDIFGFYRADVLDAALDGEVAATGFEADQVFLASTVVYVLPPILMVVLSLVLRARVNRLVNIAVSALYATSIVVSCIGETWFYYFLGSLVEVALLVVIATSAWRWPSPRTAVGPVTPVG